MRALRAGGIALLHVPVLTLPFLTLGAREWLAFAAFYLVVTFAIGAALHRYFAHRAFRVSRPVQLGLAVLTAAFFADPLGFSGRHRLHHRYSDTGRDFHGPRHGFWFAWLGHLLEDGYPEAQLRAETPDLARYPELVWLHRHGYLCGVTALALTWWLGGYSVLAAGYCLAWCLVAIHGSSAVNYICHTRGRRRYDTGDQSTNNLWLGIAMLGEGWHNNHHHYPGAARAGFFWYEPDVLYWVLRGLSSVGLVSDLREVPEAVRRRGRLT